MSRGAPSASEVPTGHEPSGATGPLCEHQRAHTSAIRLTSLHRDKRTGWTQAGSTSVSRRRQCSGPLISALCTCRCCPTALPPPCLGGLAAACAEAASKTSSKLLGSARLSLHVSRKVNRVPNPPENRGTAHAPACHLAPAGSLPNSTHSLHILGLFRPPSNHKVCDSRPGGVLTS
jgi:hypothetical protein